MEINEDHPKEKVGHEPPFLAFGTESKEIYKESMKTFIMNLKGKLQVALIGSCWHGEAGRGPN